MPARPSIDRPLGIIERSEAVWPAIAASLQRMDDRLVVEDERFAIFDLALLAIALHLQALHNLFDQPQAERTHRWVLKMLDNPEHGEYATEAVESYCAMWREGVTSGRNPLDDLAGVLLARWSGDPRGKPHDLKSRDF